MAKIVEIVKLKTGYANFVELKRNGRNGATTKLSA